MSINGAQGGTHSRGLTQAWWNKQTYGHMVASISTLVICLCPLYYNTHIRRWMNGEPMSNVCKMRFRWLSTKITGRDLKCNGEKGKAIWEPPTGRWLNYTTAFVHATTDWNTSNIDFQFGTSVAGGPKKLVCAKCFRCPECRTASNEPYVKNPSQARVEVPYQLLRNGRNT